MSRDDDVRAGQGGNDDGRWGDDAPGPDDLHPDTPDTFALRRRVLLTAFVTLVLYICALVVLDAFRAPSLYALLVAALLYAFVIRPMMRPVREAISLRRRLAYQAFLETKQGDDDRG